MTTKTIKKHFYAPIQKSSSEGEVFTGEFEGWASTEALDSDGEIILAEAFREALAKYMKFPTIREMHQPKAIGKTLSATIMEKGLWIKGKIVDTEAKLKLQESVYAAMSIGAIVEEMQGNVVTKCRLYEISLVDVPANPEAVIEMKKMAKEIIDNKEEVIETIEATDKSDNIVEKTEEVVDNVEKVEEAKFDLVKSISELLKANNVSPEDFASIFKSEEKEVDTNPKNSEIKDEADKKNEELEKSENNEVIVEKSLWNVSDFVNCINGVVWAMEDKEWEANYQNDESGKALADKMKDLVVQMGAVAGEMLQAEIDKKTKSDVISKFEKNMDLFKSAKLKVEEKNKHLNEIEKGYKDSISEKDSQINQLNETINILKSKISCDTREDYLTIEKTLKDSENTLNSVTKKIDKEEKEINEKIEKANSEEEKLRLKRELSIVEFRKSMFN